MKSRVKAKILTDESPCPCDGKERLEPRNIQNTRTPYNAKTRRQKNNHEPAGTVRAHGGWTSMHMDFCFSLSQFLFFPVAFSVSAFQLFFRLSTLNKFNNKFRLPPPAFRRKLSRRASRMRTTVRKSSGAFTFRATGRRPAQASGLCHPTE